MNTADTRLWRCPECLQTFRIRAELPDPDLCKNCSRVASEEKQTRSTDKYELFPSPTFDDEELFPPPTFDDEETDESTKSYSGQVAKTDPTTKPEEKLLFTKYLVLACLAIGLMIAFSAVIAKLNDVANPKSQPVSSYNYQVEPVSTQSQTNRIPIVSRFTETERKVIYKAIMFAFESAAQDPEWKQLDNRIDNGAQNGESPIDLGKMVDRQEEIDGRYLKALVWDRFGITDEEGIKIQYEGIRKRW